MQARKRQIPTQNTPTALIRFDKAGARYAGGPEVLQDIDLVLEPGSFHFLTGPSGAGKTTLLRLIGLAIRPTRGRMTAFGEDVAGLPRHRLPALRRRIGVVYQDFRLLPHLSLFDNVALPLRLAGRPESGVRKNVIELLEWVGLGDRLQALPQTLSGGQQQRAAIARAVIAKPAVLLADEPTGNVDEAMAMRLMYLFEQLHRLGAAVLIATHSTQLPRSFPYPSLHLENGRLEGPQPAIRATA